MCVQQKNERMRQNEKNNDRENYGGGMEKLRHGGVGCRVNEKQMYCSLTMLF